MRIFPALLTATLFAFPALAEEDTSDHLSEMDGVRLLHAWTNATDDDHGHLYIEIENQSDAEVTLTGARTDIASEVMLVALPPSGDPDQRQVLDALPVPAGSEMALAPGGVFFGLEGLTQPLLAGEEFEAILTFEPIGDIEVHVGIEAADATSHSHAGHNH